MWFGIRRVKMNPVHDSKPVPGCLLGKPQLDQLAHPVSITRWNTRSAVHPGYTVRSELHKRGPVLLFWDKSRCEFYSFLAFCPLSCCRAKYLLSNSVPNWSRAEGKASSTENCNRSFFQKFSAFLQKPQGFGLLVNTIFWYLHGCFSLETYSSIENTWKKTPNNQNPVLLM